MSFVQKINSSRSELLYLVKGKDKNKTYWHYILVDKHKLSLFKIKAESDFIMLPDYGTVLYSGWGEEPPDDIKDKVKNHFK